MPSFYKGAGNELRTWVLMITKQVLVLVDLSP